MCVESPSKSTVEKRDPPDHAKPALPGPEQIDPENPLTAFRHFFWSSCCFFETFIADH